MRNRDPDSFYKREALMMRALGLNTDGSPLKWKIDDQAS